MTVNDQKLKPIYLRHLISLNGRHKIDEGDELLAVMAINLFYLLELKKYTFVECDEDNVDPLGLSEPMIEQLKRTVRRVTIDHKIYHGGHSYILDGIQNKDAEIEQELLNMVESIY
ncbi:hypothetical protein LY90DRAFT_701276 [Neocallimastix californiae]|uniref:Uncharacterized protein n=1 Tax=Neocallimastix californiae TaxID=1754190 RepID=A0A1Y2DMK4_9FUNG|nr:hypothetical protein LY90DRAFT_701276 [Neocallimastix californiae]|eukprot:ORY60497.1 hypothetical protein LY90DRAFT_701276 [Neocallimastix californiae]